MSRPAFPLHRAAASGLFNLFSLLAIALGIPDSRLLAFAAAASLLSLFLFSRRAVQEALGSFVSPLAIVVDLALLFSAISLTGRAASPFALLLPGGLALAWHLEGPIAARFFTALSLLGVAGLLLLGAPAAGAWDLFSLLAMTLAAPALLAAFEAGRKGKPEQKAEAAAPAAPSAFEIPIRRQEQDILHDLASPLSVARVYTDLISEAARRGELPSAEHLDSLSREIDFAERLAGGEARKALEAADPHATPPASADLVEILGSLATAYRLSHPARRIEFIAERPQLPVAADPVSLQRAFRNIFENAIKYTTDAGEIRIRAGAAGRDAFVVVKDTGVGMSPEERERAFDYAFRGPGALSSGTPGKGIGLAVTKEILQANGGKISLSSEAGFGSEVTILLPFTRGAR